MYRRASVLAWIWLHLAALAVAPLIADESPRITADVIYGHKHGMALVFHLYQPPVANKAAVIQIVSGGYFSGWHTADAGLVSARPFLSRGYTVFSVFHGSNPKYNVVEIVEDIRRAVRYIRLHAAEYGIDPQRIGVMGGSAGGHLALLLATTGDDGQPDASDFVLRESSRVQAAVALAPPVDLRDPEKLLQQALERGGIDQGGVDRLRPALSYDPALGASVSPVLHVTHDDAPTFLIHGDADKLVPLENSQRMYSALRQANVHAELVVLAGVGHGSADPKVASKVTEAVGKAVDWFDKHLVGVASAE